MNRKVMLVLCILPLIFLPSTIAMSCGNLTFFTQSCALDLDPYEPPREGILSSTWTDRNTLKIEGYVKEICDGVTLTGDYQIEGEELILTYKTDIGATVTPCLCTHKMTYEISDLERKDYSISIARE